MYALPTGSPISSLTTHPYTHAKTDAGIGRRLFLLHDCTITKGARMYSTTILAFGKAPQACATFSLRRRLLGCTVQPWEIDILVGEGVHGVSSSQGSFARLRSFISREIGMRERICCTVHIESTKTRAVRISNNCTLIPHPCSCVSNALPVFEGTVSNWEKIGQRNGIFLHPYPSLSHISYPASRKI